jgi:translocation and assembly module TamA
MTDSVKHGCTQGRHFSPVLLTLGLLLLVTATAVYAAADPVQVVIRGVEGEVRENVATALTLPAGLVEKGKVNRFWVERFRKRSADKVRHALEPFGYYRATVSTALKEVGKNEFRLTVDIRPGEPVRIGQIRVAVKGAGSEEEALGKLTDNFPLKRGDVLRQDIYEKAKHALRSRAIDLGYLDADFSTHIIRIGRSRQEAQVELVLDTGPRYYFGDTTLQGAPEYPEPFLHRYLTYKRGDVFSYAKLGRTQLNLLDSDRFRQVLVRPQVGRPRDHKVPVTIRLIPAPSQRLRPGIGYGTDTGARISLNYKDVNVLKRGHEFDVNFVLAQLKQSLISTYILPSPKNINTQTAFRLGLQREKVTTYNTQSIYAEVERLRSFGQGRLGSVYLRLLEEKSDVGGDRVSSRMLLPGVRFSLNRYPDVRRPRRGYQVSLEARGGHQYLGSDTGLLQFLAAASTLLPLPARFSLFLRVHSAVSMQNQPLHDIPASLRFFAGGANSVRGYGYQSLGPKDASGTVVGGKNLLVGSIELDRALFQNWGVGVFYDAGNAFNSFAAMDLAQGAGIGVRWYTPVGPVRLDLARQIDVLRPAYRVHISVGFGF